MSISEFEVVPVDRSLSYEPATDETPILEVTIGELLRVAAEDAGDRWALVAGAYAGEEQRRRWTYRELLTDAERVARALARRYEPGTRVAVWAPNVPEWQLLQLGSAMAGTILVTVNPALKGDEVAYVLDQSGSSAVFLTAEHRGASLRAILDAAIPKVPSLMDVIEFESGWDDFITSGDDNSIPLPDVQPRDAAKILYTSGTTGAPKGAVLHHTGMVTNAKFDADAIELGPEDRWVNPMPMFHCGGSVIAALGCITARACHVLPVGFDAGLVLELLDQERATVLSAVPTMLLGLREHPRYADHDLQSLRAIVSGGSKVPGSLVREIEADLGVRVSNTYGQTEASPVITQTRISDDAQDRAETVGRPHPHTEVQIVDPVSQQPVPRGELGELCTRGYLLMQGYHEMEEVTAATIDKDGWLHTGDLCTMDERGYVSVEGRLRDMIIRGGENIYPREIEEVLRTHSKVADCAVVGVPDEKWGEVVAAVVRPVSEASDEESTVEELRAFLEERIAHFKVPTRWEFLEQFPLTPSGKIQKFVLRDLLSDIGANSPTERHSAR